MCVCVCVMRLLGLQVCELDIIFNFEKAYFILDEFLLGGEAQETSKKNVLKAIEQADLLQEVSLFPFNISPPESPRTIKQPLLQESSVLSDTLFSNHLHHHHPPHLF